MIVDANDAILRPPAPRSPEEGARRWPKRLAAALLAIAAMAVVVDRLLDPATFPVRQLSLVGELDGIDRSRLSGELATLVKSNLLAVDLEQVASAAEAAPWVRRATVRRRWPSTIEVSVERERPVARWGGDAWINDQGEAIELPDAFDPAGVPRLSGPSGSHVEVLASYRGWSELLGRHGLVIRSLALDDKRSWSATLTPRVEGAAETSVSSIVTVVGRRDAHRRLERFARVFGALDEDQRRRLAKVDLRYPNGLAVIRTPQASLSQLAQRGL